MTTETPDATRSQATATSIKGGNSVKAACVAAWLLLLIGSGEVCAQIESMEAWKAQRNARLFIYSLPSITMERHHGHHPYASYYRIEIYKDGRGYFYGLRNVRTYGEVAFLLTASEVQHLLRQFEKLNFWEMNPQLELDFSASPEARLQYQFEVRDGGREKRVFSLGGPQSWSLHKAIEDLVHSYRWRCPFVQPTTREDLCREELPTPGMPAFEPMPKATPREQK